MNVLVTGVAGFIGSQLAAALLDRGDHVIGLDAFTTSYPASTKEGNLAELHDHDDFEFHELDLVDAMLDQLVERCETVFHLAATPGVRASWAQGFRNYVDNNILATQRVLEAARATSQPRIVYASSSSVYGDADAYPVREDDRKRPRSPYGVSKLAAEHLLDTYGDAFGVHGVALRYFSVYGPRQRPDMGVHRLIEAALRGSPFTVFGTGEQVRDMTYVGDVIDATLRAGHADVPSGLVANIAGGSEMTLNALITQVEQLVGKQIDVRRGGPEAGDVQRTGGHIDRARATLGWSPSTTLEEGLAAQVAWHRQR